MHEAYELIGTEELPDIHSKGYVLRHKKSGAHISCISNDDENKVFYIGFRTPPMDSTGVPHIIEHSVLCGSAKYPLKDPFVELVKGSLNTFLNAMTYPDKTVYPVASCNDKDFQNLMDVYMDAVLHPQIYQHPEIFYQEGWHYELERVEDDITLNGVVYNEMKGAFSSPDDVLQREVFNSLFPDTAYHYESGGDPRVIPQLTYEEFIAFHQRYYHPCNAYIYLYGNMDMAEKLDYLDREYLSGYEAIDLDSSIDMQPPFSKPVRVEKEYPISSGEDPSDATYLSCSYVIGHSLNQELYQAFEVLEYALLNSPGAPIRKALVEKGIGKDIMGSYDNGTLQPTFSIVAKGANPEDEEAFLETVRKVLERQVAEGIDPDSLLAGINAQQFRFREADFGSFPKGLLYGLQALDSWLYDDERPYMHLHGIEVLDRLKTQVTEGYFEELVKEYLLDNRHVSVVVIKPKQGLTSEQDEALKAELKAYKESLSPEELEALAAQTRRLKEYQEEPTTREDMEKIPMLSREDLHKEVPPLDMREYQVAGLPVLHHDVFTNGIHYLNLVFDVGGIAAGEWGTLALLAKLLGMMDTAGYGYSDLANRINITTGGITFTLGLYAREHDDFRFTCEIRSKFLYDHVEDAMELVREIVLSTDFSDKNRLYELVKLNRSRLEMQMNSAGNAIASVRALSYFSKAAKVSDDIGGIAYYRFLKDLEENFEERADALIKDCRRLLGQVFRKEHLLVSSTGGGEALEQVKTHIPSFADSLYMDSFAPAVNEIRCNGDNEGFQDAAQIQYVCRGGNFSRNGFAYKGTMKILKLILSYEYFWMNVRVQGGAYGCMSGFARNGNLFFVSYRDPNLQRTNQVFEDTAEYVANFDVDERNMTKYIIGTISSMDTPLTPSQKGLRALSAYLSGITIEDLQRERDEVIHATKEDIRALAPAVQTAMEQNYLCVIGNEDAIEENRALFDKILPLF